MAERATNWRGPVAGLVLGLLLAALSAVDAHATPTPASPAPVSGTVAVLIDAISPLSPRPEDTVHLAGRFLNTGDTGLANLSLQVRFGPVLSRFDLHRQRTTPVTPTGFVGGPLSGPAELAAHATARFAIDLPVAGFPYRSADGVHALRIEVHGYVEVNGLAAGSAQTEVGDGDTFLPLFATAPVAPARLAWVVPVAEPPPLSADGALRDTTFTESLSAHGRLNRVLLAGTRSTATAPPTPVTWAVDPMTLQVAAALADAPFAVHTRTGPATQSKPADPAVARWLSRLRAALTSANVLALPYADVDLISLVDHGRSGDVVQAFAKGRDALVKVLGFRVPGSVAWPADGILTPAGADFLVSHGVTSVLLSDATLPPIPNLPYTPTAVTDLTVGGRPLTATVADGDLSALVAAGPDAAATSRMAEQLFLAETAMITSQRPSVGQDLVVLPPRNWDPGTSYGRAVIADSAAVPWLHAVPLSRFGTDPRDIGSRQPLTFPPASPEPDPLPGDLITGIGGTRSALHDLATVLSAPATAADTAAAAALIDPVETALFEAESAAWRTEPTSGYALAQEADAATQRLRGQVRAVAARVLTLTSASSPIPVTVVNDLPVQVKVTLLIEAANRAKLASAYRQPVTLPAHAKLRVNVPVHVESAGTFTVLVSVLSPSGQALGQPQQFVIRSAAYGRVALIVTLGALALLVVAILLRAVRRLRTPSAPPPAAQARP